MADCIHSIVSSDLGTLELTDLEYYQFKIEETNLWIKYRRLHKIGLKKEKRRMAAFNNLINTKEQLK